RVLARFAFSFCRRDSSLLHLPCIYRDVFPAFTEKRGPIKGIKEKGRNRYPAHGPIKRMGARGSATLASFLFSIFLSALKSGGEPLPAHHASAGVEPGAVAEFGRVLDVPQREVCSVSGRK